MVEKRKIDVEIGKKLLELRTIYNLTQKEVGEALGIKRSTYKQYENGYRALPIKSFKDLSKYYKVPYDYFFKDINELEFEDEIFLNKLKLALNSNDEKVYIGNVLDPKEMKKYVETTEIQVQARARFRIKQLRIENNKKQEDISKYLNIDNSTYCKYENGSRKLDLETVKKIAEYYNVDFKEIID